jgi:hypothetical protein
MQQIWRMWPGNFIAREITEDGLKMMEISPIRAYFMGCVASRFGKSIESNPFEEFSDTWKKYREGWSHAEEYPYSFQSSKNLYACQEVSY